MDNPYDLSDEQFNEYLEHALDYIASMLADKKETAFTPTMIVHTIDKEGESNVNLCLMPDFDMEKRHTLIAALGSKFASEGKIARCVFFLSEAWTAQFSQEQFDAKDRPMPRDMPNRIEVVQVAGLSFDQRANLGRVTVTRDKKNHMIPGERESYPYGGDVKIQNNLLNHFYKGQALILLQQRMHLN